MRTALCLALLWGGSGSAAEPEQPADKAKDADDAAILRALRPNTLPAVILEMPFSMGVEPIPLARGLVLAPREPGPSRPTVAGGGEDAQQGRD